MCIRDSAGANRVYKSIDEIPKDLQNAFVAIEDSRFYEHNGIDLKGIVRAGLKGITSGHFSEGDVYKRQRYTIPLCKQFHKRQFHS